MTTPPPQDPYGNPGSQPPPSQGYGPGFGSSDGPAPPGYGPPPQTWGAPGPGAGQSTDPKAIVALVCAIGAFVVLPVIPAIVALVLAAKAKRDIAAAGGRLTGTGLVTAARVIAWIHLALCVVAVVGLVLLFGAFTVGGVGEGQTPTY